MRARFTFSRNIGCFGSPDEGFGLAVMPIDVSADSVNEFLDVTEDTAPQTILRQIAEEAFYHVQPGTASRGKVNSEARVPAQPALHFGMFMGGVVVHNEVDHFLERRDLIDHAQEAEPLLMPVTVVAHGDYAAIERVESGK